MTTSRGMKVLFCAGMPTVADTPWQRSEILRDLGFDVSPFDYTRFLTIGTVSRIKKLIMRARFEFPPAAVTAFNVEFLNRIDAVRPDVVWVEKALMLRPETLEKARRIVPHATFVCCQEDNPFGSRRVDDPLWRYPLTCVPLYDLQFVKRAADIRKYEELGARRVRIMGQGFYPPIHRSYLRAEVPDDLSHEVVFVGTPLDHRITAISQLLGEERLPLIVYGGRWNRYSVYYRHPQAFRPPITGAGYAQVISASKISLGYVSSSNLDEFTMRSFEIPAAGGFLLAERTPAHQEMYVEGEEAEFFTSTRECADKIRYYLRDDSARCRIAAAGHRRAIGSDYSLTRCVREAVQELTLLRVDRCSRL